MVSSMEASSSHALRVTDGPDPDMWGREGRKRQTPHRALITRFAGEDGANQGLLRKRIRRYGHFLDCR